jgi:hypothetical protein
VKQTFTNFPTAHRNLGSSKATTNRLGGFTSKSNKCHEDCFTNLKSSSAHKEDLTQPLAWISHKSLKSHLEVKGEVSRAQGRVFSFLELATLKAGKGGSFYTIPQKTSRWKLASRNLNIRFWNRNIWFLKYSCYRPNRTLCFGNRNIRFFQDLVRAGVYEAIVFHSSHLGF